MEEKTAVCQRCGASLTLPLPDAIGTEKDGLIQGAELSETDARECLRMFLEDYLCPTCEYCSLRVPAV